MAIFNTYDSYVITSVGGTTNIDINANNLPISVGSSGTIVLAAAYNFVPSGTPKLGHQIKFLYNGNTTLTTDTASGKHISFFGNIITNNQAQGQLEIDVYWNGVTWVAVIKPNFNASKTPVVETANVLDSAITTAKINAKAITLEKTADISEGNIYIGNSSSRPEALDISTDKGILIGDGTSATPRVISGDVTISNTGVAAIGAGKVTESMLAFTLADLQYEDLEISSAQLLDLYNTPITIIPAQGANTVIVPIEAWAFLDYDAATYAAGGTVQLTLNSIVIGTLASTAVTSAADLYTKFDLSTAVSNGSIANKSLDITNATAVFTTGDSPLKIRIIYKVLNFA